MSNEKVQNNEATVENITEKVKNEVAKKVTKDVFKKLIAIDNISNLTDDIVENMMNDLRDKSFMTVSLELTKDQREALLDCFPTMIQKVKQEYIENLETDKRTKMVTKEIKESLQELIDESLAQIGQEVNRGAIISSTAVSADTKPKDHNKIELNHSKSNGDITIPTQGIFISTNCIKVIKDTILDENLREEEEKEEVVDPETGEVTS